MACLFAGGGGPKLSPMEIIKCPLKYFSSVDILITNARAQLQTTNGFELMSSISPGS